MTDPVRCKCKGCASCSPTTTLGECGREAGDYVGVIRCKECHDRAAASWFLSLPQTNALG